MREEDGLESLEFTASGVVTDAAEDLATMTEYWEHAAGEPAACLPAFLSSALVDERESGASGDDATMELANFREVGDVVGLVIVNARLFDTTGDAAAFLDARRTAVDACPDGYTLSDHGELSWRTAGFEFGDLAGTPTGVRSLVIDELPTGTDATGQRTVYLQRGNAVVAVYGESYAGGTLEMDDLLPVAVAIAERLAAI